MIVIKEPLKIIFAGTPEFSAVALDALLHSEHDVIAVYTQPDRPAGRGRKLTASPGKQLALQHRIPVYQPTTLRDANEQQILANLKADLMVVVAYGLILPLPVLQAPRFGCMNIHASLLPRWRGAAPIQRAILAGDLKTGITIMQMDEGLDTGDMLYKVECPIHANDTSQTLHDRLAKLGAEALLVTLERLLTNHLHPEKQDNTHACYAAKISKEEAQIDWNLSAQEIEHKIRAFNPWPVAQTFMNGEVLRVWQAEVIEKSIASAKAEERILASERLEAGCRRNARDGVFGASSQYASSALADAVGPGVISHAAADGIDVVTGSGLLRLQKMQLPGGRVLLASDLMNAKVFSAASCGKKLG